MATIPAAFLTLLLAQSAGQAPDAGALTAAAREKGLDFAELCWRILETSFAGQVRSGTMEAAANDA